MVHARLVGVTRSMVEDLRIICSHGVLRPSLASMVAGKVSASHSEGSGAELCKGVVAAEGDGGGGLMIAKALGTGC